MYGHRLWHCGAKRVEKTNVRKRTSATPRIRGMGRPGYYLLRQRSAGMRLLRTGRHGHHQGGNPEVRNLDTTATRIDIPHASISIAQVESVVATHTDVRRSGGLRHLG
jgi:hypothetical protein